MIDAAESLFFERGFTGTTVEAVAERAGVSKVTLYAHFGDRNGLFEAVIGQVAERMEQGLAATARDQPLAATLEHFGITLLTEILSAKMIDFERHLAPGLRDHPELAARCFDAGPGRFRRKLADILAAAMQRGELASDDPGLAADDLFGLWHGFISAETKFAQGCAPTAPQIRARVARGVQKFLAAYRPH